MSNKSSILVTGASSGIGKATARDWSSYLTGSDRLQARGRSRLWVKAVMVLITLTAMAAAISPSPHQRMQHRRLRSWYGSHARVTELQLSFIPVVAPRSCCATASRTTTTCTTALCRCSRGMRS